MNRVPAHLKVHYHHTQLSSEQIMEHVTTIMYDRATYLQNALMTVTANPDGSPMTVQDATEIADRAQENFANLLLDSLDCLEVFSCHKGMV